MIKNIIDILYLLYYNKDVLIKEMINMANIKMLQWLYDKMVKENLKSGGGEE